MPPLTEQKDTFTIKNRIAVQTEYGLLVPVLKAANDKTIPVLAKEISDLTTTARENKLSMDQMKGGTCTISNIGSAGEEWFTPIINYQKPPF